MKRGNLSGRLRTGLAIALATALVVAGIPGLAAAAPVGETTTVVNGVTVRIKVTRDDAGTRVVQTVASNGESSVVVLDKRSEAVTVAETKSGRTQRYTIGGQRINKVAALADAETPLLHAASATSNSTYWWGLKYNIYKSGGQWLWMLYKPQSKGVWESAARLSDLQGFRDAVNDCKRWQASLVGTLSAASLAYLAGLIGGLPSAGVTAIAGIVALVAGAAGGIGFWVAAKNCQLDAQWHWTRL